MYFFFVPLKRKRIKDFNLVVMITGFPLHGGVETWQQLCDKLFSPHFQEQLMFQCRCMLFASNLESQLPSGQCRCKYSFTPRGLSTQGLVSLLCNEISLLSAKSLLWFGCVPQRPYVRNQVPSVWCWEMRPLMGWLGHDGSALKDGLMWFPWEWAPHHKNDFVPKVGSVSACFPLALPWAGVTRWHGKKFFVRCQDFVFGCPGF